MPLPFSCRAAGRNNIKPKRRVPVPWSDFMCRQDKAKLTVADGRRLHPPANSQRLAAPLGMPISTGMSLRSSKVLTLGLAVVFCAWGAEHAFARSKKHRIEPSVVPSMMLDEGGTPIIMQGLERPKRPVEDKDHPTNRAERLSKIPRGSSGTVPPPVPSPRGGPPSQPPPAPYNPPPINSFSDRVTQCLHSFPLNAGLGNNPTNRDAYVRSCAN
jgi:hypothetical protein